MRRAFLAFFVLLPLLLYGCTATGTARNESNAAPTHPAPPAAQSENASAPAQQPPVPAETSGNISSVDGGSPSQPAIPGGEANGTGGTNETRGTNGTGGTPPAPPPVPEGLSFGNGSYLIALDDVSLIPWSAEPCGIFSLHLSDGALLEKLFICPGQSETWESPDGGSYRILVVKVAGGYTGTRWAQVIVYG